VHKLHKQSGFTVIELLVVIVVIGILVGIGILSYTQLQKQARDDKRNSDITLIQNLLEKYYDRNGEYPPGCPSATCTSWFFTQNTSSSQMLNSTATIADIQGVLPGLNNAANDPLNTTTTPLMDISTSTKKYYYFGGTVNNNGSGGSSLSYAATASFPCSVNVALNAGEVGSYVIGYFSEENNAWVLNGGKNGKKMTITAGTPAQGCVINAT
jgi:prepilin-type N-terminal cleavage/methylation domain-containing protein